MDREKMVQIYEAMADMTLEMLNKEKRGTLYLDPGEFEMVRTTQSLYETVNCTNQPAVVAAFENPSLDSHKSQYGCKYTDRPDVR